MAEEIRNNLVFLTENLTNLQKVLILCVQHSIISTDEWERIMAGETSLDRNVRFFNLLVRKDWEEIKITIVKVLRDTLNAHCADKIEYFEKSQAVDHPKENLQSIQLKPKIFDSKWWPEEKRLPMAFQERKSDDNKLVDILKEKLTKSKNGSTVINQEAAVSGMGGVGKTTAAKWFARDYQDSYDHIIWIDCGEGNLMSSFIELAKELKIDGNLRLNLLARKCFSKLDGLKCLWIFDNAECYQGHQGIREVLPKNDNFHSLITSRTKEWGSDSGDGEIPELHLTAFSQFDSIEFLTKNLKDDLYTLDQSEELSDLLGNLPLALQIAVTTINSKKLSLASYIERIKQTDHIINQNFDDYEKTINKTMKISLDIIKNHESDPKQTAHKILLILGYIKPDYVDFKLFESIGNLSTFEVAEAMELLEKYSLVTTHVNRYCNIHRLLQQVIRHNGKEDEENTLKMILTAEGFLEYKLLPYLYASPEVQIQFPKIRAQLIDQRKLNDFMEQRRFSEAVELSRMIKDIIMTPTAMYNYAVCLEKMNELSEAVKVLEKLHEDIKGVPNSKMLQLDNNYNTVSPDINRITFRTDGNGILQLSLEMKSELIGGLLFLVYTRLAMFDEANRIAEEERMLIIFKTTTSLNCVIKLLRDHSAIGNYHVNNSQKFISLTLERENYGKKISLQNCCLSEDFPKDLDHLLLNFVDMLNADLQPEKHYNLTISKKLKKLEIECSDHSTRFSIQINDDLLSCNIITLKSCTILLNHGCRLIPRTIKLDDILFIRDGDEIETVSVNEFVDFQNTNQSSLYGKNLSLDLGEPFSVENVFLYGFKSCLNWGQFNWTIDELTLMSMDVPLVENDVTLNLSTLHLRYCSIHLTSLFFLSKNVKNVILFNVELEFDQTRNQVLVATDKIKLTDIELIQNSVNVIGNISLGKIFDLAKIKELSVNWSEENSSTPILDLQENISAALYLERVKIINWDKSNGEIEDLTLKYVEIQDVLHSQFRITDKLTILDSVIDLASLNTISSATKALDLYRTTIKLTNQGESLSKSFHLNGQVEYLDFHEMTVLNEGEKVDTIVINQLVNISKLNIMKLYCPEGEKNQIVLDMADENISFDTLSLSNVKILNWEKGNGKIEELSMFNSPFLKKNQVKINSLNFGSSLIDLLCLPDNIQRISLFGNSTVTCKGKLVLNGLTYVHLSRDHSVLKYFFNCRNLSKVELGPYNGKIVLDLQMIPKGVKVMKLYQHPFPSLPSGTLFEALGIGKHSLNTIIFVNFPLADIEFALTRFETENIIIKNMNIRLNKMSANSTPITLITSYQMKTLAIGRFNWETDEEYENSCLTQFLEERGNYYIFKKQRGSVIHEPEFDKLAVL